MQIVNITKRVELVSRQHAGPAAFVRDLPLSETGTRPETMTELKFGAESRGSLRVIFWSALAGAVLLVVLFLVVAPDRWSVGLFATIPFLIVARAVHSKQSELPKKPVD